MKKEQLSVEKYLTQEQKEQADLLLQSKGEAYEKLSQANR
jgi:hypothetical protein